MRLKENLFIYLSVDIDEGRNTVDSDFTLIQATLCKLEIVIMWCWDVLEVEVLFLKCFVLCREEIYFTSYFRCDL